MDGRESLLLAPTKRGARARVHRGGVGAWAGTQVCHVCAGASRLTMMVPRQGVQALSVVPHKVRVGGQACAGGCGAAGWEVGLGCESAGVHGVGVVRHGVRVGQHAQRTKSAGWEVGAGAGCESAGVRGGWMGAHCSCSHCRTQSAWDLLNAHCVDDALSYSDPMGAACERWGRDGVHVVLG
ncbi:hypothetical protein C8J57DRAFT_1329732, partial [Mycena rebaudengoi]